MLALILYALFLACLAAAFMTYVMEPLPAEKPALTFEQVVRPNPPRCDDAPDFYRCLNP